MAYSTIEEADEACRKYPAESYPCNFLGILIGNLIAPYLPFDEENSAAIVKKLRELADANDEQLAVMVRQGDPFNEGDNELKHLIAHLAQRIMIVSPEKFRVSDASPVPSHPEKQ